MPEGVEPIMMRYGYGGFGMGGGLGLVLMLAFWVVFAAVVVGLIVWSMRGSHQHPRHDYLPGQTGQPPASPPAASVPPAAGPAHDEAVAIARRRFAAGELSKEQFDEIMKTLHG
jgi:uncharacterized membrane protein